MKREHDFRTTVVVNFLLALVIAGLVKGIVDVFDLLPPPRLGEARVLDRIAAILACVGLAAFGVLLSVRFGIKHFKTFSRVDKILSRLPVGILGLALAMFSGYSVLTKPYDYHRAFGVRDPVLLLVGSFLFTWVFLLYGRDTSRRVRGGSSEH